MSKFICTGCGEADNDNAHCILITNFYEHCPEFCQITGEECEWKEYNPPGKEKE